MAPYKIPIMSDCDTIKEQVDVKNTKVLSESKMFQNVLQTRLQVLAIKTKDISNTDHNKNIELEKCYLVKAQMAYEDDKFNETNYYLQHAENIFYNKQDYYKSGQRKCGAWLRRMEHLEMAGAPLEAPGTNDLIINDLPDEMIIHIFSMMDFESLLVAAKVCTRWQTLCMAPAIWRYKKCIIHKRNYVEISENIMPIVVKCLSNVKLININLSEAAQLRDALISYCPNLIHLEINVVGLDTSLLDDLHHWPNLEILCIRVRKPKFCGAVRHLGDNSPFKARKLKTLQLQIDIPSKAAKLITSLISYCPNLTHLEIWGAVGRDILDNLHHLPNLKFLCFYGYVTDMLAYNTDILSYNFEKLKNLESLTLPNINLVRDSLYSMLKCENLVSINMKNMRNIPVDFIDSLLRTKQLTLRALYIYGDTLNDDIMRQISNCRQLQELHICRCHNLSDSSLLHLSRLENLQSLQLFQGNFSKSAMVEYLTNNTFQQMKVLRLPNFFPTDRVIEIFKTKAPNLKHFYNEDGL